MSADAFSSDSPRRLMKALTSRRAASDGEVMFPRLERVIADYSALERADHGHATAMVEVCVCFCDRYREAGLVAPSIVLQGRGGSEIFIDRTSS